MNPNSKSTENQLIQQKFLEILKLYGNSPIETLLNDLVAIGTWPEPERPEIKPPKLPDNFKIDTVPLPDKPKELKKLLQELINLAAKKPLKELF